MNFVLINIIYCLMGAATATALIGHITLSSRGWIRNIGNVNFRSAKYRYQCFGLLGIFVSLLLNTLTVCITPLPNPKLMMCLELYAVAAWGFMPMQALALMEVKIGVKQWLEYALPFVIAFVLTLFFGNDRPDVCEIIRNVLFFGQLLVYFRTYYLLCQWDKKMRDIYSDIAHKETVWFRKITIIAQFLALCWIPMKIYPESQWMWIVYYILLIAVILLFTGHAILQENLENRDVILELHSAIKPSKKTQQDDEEVPVEEDAEEEKAPAQKTPVWAATLDALMNEEHLYREANLDIISLAEKVGVNRTYLSQYFNRNLGCSFYEYINNFRLEESLTLLADLDLNIDAVALRCGFSNQSVFSRTFRKRYDMSPSQWRKSLRKQ